MEYTLVTSYMWFNYHFLKLRPKIKKKPSLTIRSIRNFFMFLFLFQDMSLLFSGHNGEKKVGKNGTQNSRSWILGLYCNREPLTFWAQLKNVFRVSCWVIQFYSLPTLQIFTRNNCLKQECLFCFYALNEHHAFETSISSSIMRVKSIQRCMERKWMKRLFSVLNIRL